MTSDMRVYGGGGEHSVAVQHSVAVHLILISKSIITKLGVQTGCAWPRC